jgi:hypothetical protein
VTENRKHRDILAGIGGAFAYKNKRVEAPKKFTETLNKSSGFWPLLRALTLTAATKHASCTQCIDDKRVADIAVPHRAAADRSRRLNTFVRSTRMHVEDLFSASVKRVERML